MRHGFLSLCAALALTACGGGGGSDAKPLASVWTQTETGSTLDLRGIQPGTDLVVALYPPSAVRCLCRLAVIGTDQSGSFAITSCIVSPYNSRTNGQCTALNATGNYTNTGDILTLSTSRGSNTYR